MRIISQGGHADLPYERTQLCSNTENVMARCDGKEYLMGSYATHEKAIKAMKMCREQYAENEFNKELIPSDSNVLTITPDGKVESENDRFKRKYVFQFPADEEVE